MRALAELRSLSGMPVPPGARAAAVACVLGASFLAAHAAQDTVTVQLTAPWAETPPVMEAR